MFPIHTLSPLSSYFSSSSSSGSDGGGGGFWENKSSSTTTEDEFGFRPRRRPPPSYRPIPSRRTKPKGPLDPESAPPLQDEVYELGGPNYTKPSRGWYDDDMLERQYGPVASEFIKHTKRQREWMNNAAAAGGGARLPTTDIESQLRVADYMTSEIGTTEDLVGQRRGIGLDARTERERMEFQKELDKFIQEEYIRSLELGEDDIVDETEREDDEITIAGDDAAKQKLMGQDDMDMMDENEDPNTEVHGDWSETIIRVDRVQKVQRGGTMVRYRCLVVGGNTNGVAGFGIGKANSPKEATEKAARKCKRDVFFADRYLNSGLTTDLAGRHNSCRVILRSVQPNYGLRGHPLITLILKYFGITDCTAKSFGNRNIYNVVRATFKAVATHESMEDIALKRGKRLLNLDRAKRLQI